MSIYTKTGDRGETGIWGGKRVAKDSALVEALGSIDELNAQLGIVLAQIKNKKIKQDVEKIQQDLFSIGSAIAGFEGKTDWLEERVKYFEEEIDRMWEALPELNNFILPGGSEMGARLHLARTMCRRAERMVIGAKQDKAVKYLNRLSDYLFCLARWVNWKTGIRERKWIG